MIGRLVGVDLRSSTANGEVEREINWLPVPCACPMLRNGWSRRASSSYSPFYDGDGVWSRSESDPRGAAVAAGTAARGGEGGEVSTGSEGTDERGDAERDEQWMPNPTVVADVLIEDLSFSLRSETACSYSLFLVRCLLLYTVGVMPGQDVELHRICKVCRDLT